MLGGRPYQTPYLLAEVDREMFGVAGPVADAGRGDRGMLPYIEAHIARGGRLNNIVRHMLGLYHGVPGARAFRRHLSENAPRAGAGGGCLARGSALVETRAAKGVEAAARA